MSLEKKTNTSLLSKIIYFLFSDSDSSVPLFFHSLKVEDQLFDFTLVRFLVSFLIVIASLFGRYILQIEEINCFAFLILALLLFLVNCINFVIIYPLKQQKEKVSSYRLLINFLLHFSIATDFFFLTIALWLVGGIYSPFQYFFIFHVIIASVLLKPLVAFAYTMYGYILFLLLAVGTWKGWFPAHFPIGAVPTNSPPSGIYVLTVVVVQGLLFFLTSLLVTHLMYFLRESQKQLMRVNKDLELLCDQRKGFLQIALHNLRSPVSAISMHLQNLINGYGGEINSIQREWVERSLKRCDELISFLKDLENLSILEKADLQSESKVFDINELINEILEENQDLLSNKQQEVILELSINPLFVNGIKRLVKEAVINLLTNAVKYTPESGKIFIRTLSKSNKVRVEVEDTGVGIPESEIPKLFKEFVRINYNIPGFTPPPGSGLGLFIVRQVVENHGGNVYVFSKVGKGSIFGFELPQIVPKE
ncbi:MAG: HAMP domain-containing histidine kinase [Candidatus Hydrogenedentes bacterium]|nr:HAMP domain-containing histidine kinase [Candidatus Hydrogenedentota bacterium]